MNIMSNKDLLTESEKVRIILEMGAGRTNIEDEKSVIARALKCYEGILNIEAVQAFNRTQTAV